MIKSLTTAVDLVGEIHYFLWIGVCYRYLKVSLLYCRCRPKILQYFHNVHCALIILSVSYALQVMLTAGLVPRSYTFLERRFGFTNPVFSAIEIAAEVGMLAFCMIIAIFGKKG